MAQPVWVLSVDLQTKTATFQTGLADAARSARSAFKDIQTSSGEMSSAVGGHGADVRHTLGLVDNVLRGDHMRAFVDVIRIYQDSSIVMGALPFAAVAGGFALIAGVVIGAVVKLHEWRMEAEKLRDSMTDAQTVGQNAFNAIGDRILEASKRAAELRNNHLEALRIELQLIDHQSMQDLVSEFEKLDKAAGTVFSNIKSHWYTLGVGADGASHALEQFKTQYDSLVSQGNTKGAGELLSGTLDQAQQVLSLMQEAKRLHGAWDMGPHTDTVLDQLQAKTGHYTYTDKEVAAQQQLVSTLEQQLKLTGMISTLKKDDQGNATKQEGNDASGRNSTAARAAVEAQLAMGRSALTGEKASADAQLTIHRATIEQRLASDMDFAGRERAMKVAANQEDISALDKSGKEYQNQLKALNEKSLEIQQDYATQIAELKAKAATEENERDLQNVEESIREQIGGTQQGTAARLAAIDAGIREEQALHLQDTQFYRDLATQRVQAAREMAEEQAKLSQGASAEGAGHDSRMGGQRIDAQKQANELANSGHRTNRDQVVKQQTDIANQQYAIQMAGLQKQVEGLDKSGKDYQNKLKALQDKETELVQQHANEITAIKDKAAEQQNQSTSAAYQRFVDMTSQGLTQSIMRHQTWAQMMTSLSNQVISGMMENAIKSVMMADFDKEREAASAARKFFLAGAQLPFPANIVAAPALAAGAFASMMAFQAGTDMVPGVGRGDIVPTMLEPGEGVVPGGVMDGLRSMAREGGFNQRGSTVHLHVRPTYHVQTIDGDGMQRALEKHSDQLQHHMEKAMRKANH